MNRKAVVWMTLSLSMLMMLSGCGNQKRNVYEQAGKDLDQGYYEYALDGYEEVIAEGKMLVQAYRGAGIANLRLGKYKAAIKAFTHALEQPKVSSAMKKDLLAYRATAYLKKEKYDEALADCQVLASDYEMDANSYFLTGMVSLEMDAYGQATSNFDLAYASNPSYDMAIRIYQVYLEKGLEADGTKYLEVALDNVPETAEDFCNRGKVYYYMEDYESARKELIQASNQNNTEALLLLGMVYLGQKDISNSRSMYQEYISKVGSSAKGYNGLAQCDLSEGNYESALSNISKGLETATTEEMQDLLFNEMIVYEKQLNFATAREKAKEYLRLFPNDETMQRELVFLNSRTK